MSFPLFNIFLSSGDDQRRKTVKKKKNKTRCASAYVVHTCVCASWEWLSGCFHTASGKNKEGEKGFTAW